jgi:hypothetical protein
MHNRACLVKMDVLLTVLDRTIVEIRDVPLRETQLLQTTIGHSDNDTATVLWQAVGGASVQHYLQRLGLTDFQPGQDEDWGTSPDIAVARLLSSIAHDTLLAARRQTLALVLLSRLEAPQRSA